MNKTDLTIKINGFILDLKWGNTAPGADIIATDLDSGDRNQPWNITDSGLICPAKKRQGMPFSGSGYIYQFQNGQWQQNTRVQASKLQNGDSFSCSVFKADSGSKNKSSPPPAGADNGTRTVYSFPG